MRDFDLIDLSAENLNRQLKITRTEKLDRTRNGLDKGWHIVDGIPSSEVLMQIILTTELKTQSLSFMVLNKDDCTYLSEALGRSFHPGLCLMHREEN